MKRRTLAAVLAASAAAVLAVPAAQAQEVTLRMHTFIPPVANPARTFLIPWAEKVTKESGGRLRIQPFWAMQLGGAAPQLLDQARDGVVDIVWVLPGFTPGRMPRSEPFELPFVHRDALSSTLALQDFQDKHLAADLKGYFPILMHAHDGFLIATKRPVRRMDDLKGMKIRAAARSGVWMLEALGAAGIGLPLNEIPQALSRGVIDGVTLTYEIAPSLKLEELVDHFTELSGPQPRLGTNVFAFLMNRASYDKLPPDLKKVIDANAGRNIARWAGENWREIENPGKKAMQAKAQNQFHVIPPDEVARMRKASQPVIERWLAEVKKAGIDGKALLADAQALIDKYAK
ncbi:MAG TPA: TRAP transporter substrate-binding protein [Burkholderiales bacterium]|nr:TRAP transporter substrate-binding protein [Burkholderiales bacterium]